MSVRELDKSEGRIEIKACSLKGGGGGGGKSCQVIADSW